jgi:hypothetical protein
MRGGIGLGRNINIFNIRKKKNRSIYINSESRGTYSISYSKREGILSESINFKNHLSKYIGQTVTVYITSGGNSGNGYTGLLFSISNDYIRIIIELGPEPLCSIGTCFYTSLKNNIQNQTNINTLGSVIDVPIKSIAAFVHNTISGVGHDLGY